ncbi:hypothetical protein GQ457_03G024680 [Hibiscus cannabinus]
MFDMPSRTTIRRDILDIYEEGKVKTMSKLEANEGRIAITVDVWTVDHQNKEYMVVIVHYIDNSWTPRKRIIRFECVPTPYTMDVITSNLMKCFVDWNIDRKLVSITLDNCTVNDGIVGLLVDKLGNDKLLLNGTFFHMRCFAHILNLIVKGGLSVLGDGIERIRHSVIFWSDTPERWKIFEDIAPQLGILITNKLCADVETLWSSTFLMLQTALSYKDVFSRCLQLNCDPLYEYLPTEDDWTLVAEICEKCKLFYEINEGFSRTKYTMGNLYFPTICSIRVTLNEWIVNSNSIILGMAKRMLEKFEKYWSDVNGFVGVATLLDPRYKTLLLEYYFEDIYEVAVESEVEKIVQLCRILVKEYQEKMLSRESEAQSFSTTPLDRVAVDPGHLKDFDAYVSRKRQKKLKVISELDCYLEEDVFPRTSNFDILNWWKINGSKFPILQAIARDIYDVPVFNVALKSIISTRERLMNEQRDRLLPSTVEALACCKNWLWDEEGT